MDKEQLLNVPREGLLMHTNNLDPANGQKVFEFAYFMYEFSKGMKAGDGVYSLVNNSDLSPIELTAEWLERLGWEWDNAAMSWENNGFRYVPYTGEILIDGWLVRHSFTVQYVHEMQSFLKGVKMRYTIND